jgi:hypothetical protein
MQGGSENASTHSAAWIATSEQQVKLVKGGGPQGNILSKGYYLAEDTFPWTPDAFPAR